MAFSNVTVVDAAGRLERIRPSLATGREILFEVSREFLENSRYPILIDPLVGPEFPVEPSPVIGPASGYQGGTSVASNGTDYFAVWAEPRSSGTGNIYGARVTSAGTILDPLGIPVSTAANDQLYPSAASNGTDYFVAWEDFRSGVDDDIYGARVTSAGTVLDPAGIAVSTAVNDQVATSVASDGTDYFVAWWDFRSGVDDDIYGARVASDGTVLDPAGIAVSTAADNQSQPSAASNGTDYFIAWMDARNGTDYDIYGARVTSAGTVLDPAGIAVSTAVEHQQYASVASNGTDYFVAWADRRNWGTTYFDIYGTRVASDGTVLDPAGIAVSTEADGQSVPSVVSNGTDYFVAWSDRRSGVYDIYGTRVASSDGTVLDPAGIAVSTAADNQSQPSAASNGTDYFVAWQDRRSGTDYDIYGARVASSDGTVLDPAGFAVATAASDQELPSVASNETDYFVVWQDKRSDAGWDIYGARVASGGTVLDPLGIAVSTAASSQAYPSVASNGTDYFVAWEDYRSGAEPDIYGARVTSAGTVLDPSGVAVSTAASWQQFPSVASNGTDYFVAWKDSRNPDRDIYGARVTSAGMVLDPAGIAVSTAAKSQGYPSVASNGTDYFVAWDDWRSDWDYDIYGTRVASDGTVLDPLGIAVSTAASSQAYPSVASNGTDYFVAWEDYRSGADYDIYGARVRASDGLLLDGPPDTGGIAVSTAANNQWFPFAASNGTDYFVAWQDRRSGADYDIYGARVASSDGTVLDPTALLIQQSPYDDLNPAVAYSACGKYLVAYHRFRDETSFQSQRIMARMFYEDISVPNVAYDTSFDPVATLVEVCGDGDAVVEPGEEWQATVQLINGALSPCAIANDTIANLTVNAASAVAATVCNNPGAYGNIPAGGTAQFAYSFVVDPAAVCINDITFDVTNIVSDEGAYASEIPAFAVQVGALAPGPTETAAQATDPLTAQNETLSSNFSPAFTIPGAAKSATLSYTLSGTTDLVNCVEVALVDPLGTATVVKPLGAADANPYDVTGLYTGPGTYQLQLTEAGKGCGGGGEATVTAGTLSVTAPDVIECDASACLCPPCPALSCAAGVDAAVVCNGAAQTFTATPSGGVVPYIYEWDFSYDGITFNVEGSGNPIVYTQPAAGSYTVAARVTDSCSMSAQTTICTVATTVNANPAAVITPSGPTTFCEGGSVDLVASSATGTPPFTYLWSTGDTTATITVTTTDTYSVTITDSAVPACSDTSAGEAVTVNPSPAAVITPSGPTTFCEGGSVDFVANSATGTPPFTYLWSTGDTTATITVTMTDTYSVTITDSAVPACSDTSLDEVVTVNPSPAAVITPSGSTTFCEGGSVDLVASSATGTPPFTYLWSTGDTTATITVTMTDTYSVTITDSAVPACSDTSAGEAVTVNANPVPAIGESPCSGGNVTLNAGTGYAGYLWSTGATTQTITVAGDGAAYDVTVTDASGCSGSDSHTTTVCEPSLVYSSQSLTDCGNADGLVDPGETIDLSVTVQNTGGAGAFNVSGVLSTVTSGITITTNTAAFPDIPAGLAGAPLSPFQFVVDLSVPCGTLIDFTLDLSYQDDVGNPFSSAVPFQVPVSAGGPVTFLSEDFNLGLPVAWTVVDGGNGPDTWTDSVTSVLNGCPDRGLFPDTYMIADGDCAGSGAFQDEELITPPIDASTASTVTLRFDHYFKGYATDGVNDDFGTVRVRSALTGGVWSDLIQWDENDDTGVETITLDATAECAGAADCQFGWRYEGNWDWYWAVDNVVVDGIGGCSPATCGGAPSEPSPPGALDPLIIPTTDADQIIVEDVENETGYVVYEEAIGTWYGTPSQGCLWGAADVVDLGATVRLNYSLGLGDRWVVVSAANASGESSCGTDSAGIERNTVGVWPAPGPCP